MTTAQPQGTQNIPSQAGESAASQGDTATGTVEAAGSPAMLSASPAGGVTTVLLAVGSAEQGTPDQEPASLVVGVVGESEAAGVAEAVGEGGEAGAETAAAVDVEVEAGETFGGTAEAAADVPPGRPHKSLLAGAAIVGALLVAVPFLVSSGGEEEGVAPAGATPGTVLGSPAGSVMVGPIESAPPTENSTSQKPRSGKSPAGQGGAGGPRVGGGSAAGTPVARGVGGSGSSSVGEDPKPLPRPSAAQTLGKSGSSGESSSVPGVSIRSHHSGRCIDVTDGEGDGTPLQIWGCSGAAQQTWRFMDDGTVRSMSLCMDVAWGATGNGAVIQLARCSGHPAQQFRLNSSHDLVNPQADKCVDVREQQVANGSRLQLWDCNGQDNQKWSAG